MSRSVIGTLARFEVRGWRRDASISVALLTWIGLLVLACANGLHDLGSAVAARTTVLEQDAERYEEYAARAEESARLLDGRVIDPLTRWVQHGPTHPAWLGGSWGPRRALRPVPPLRALMVGNVDTAPGSYSVSTDALLELGRTSVQTEHPVRQLLGRVDLGFLALYCLPLLLIALGADLVAADRERGILPLIKAQGVSPAMVALVRWSLRASIVTAPLLAAAVVTGVMAVGSQLEWLFRAVGWAALVGAYASAWAAAVFAAASFGQSRAVTALWLVAAWAVVCLILPAAVQAFVMHAAPTASRAEFFSTYRAADAEVTQMPAVDALDAYLAARPDLAQQHRGLLAQSEFPLASAESRILIEARQQQVAARLAPAAAAFSARRDRQRDLVTRVSLLSPMTMVYDALTAVAGTGDDAQEQFETAVQDLHARWRAFFLPRMFAMAPLTGDDYRCLPDLHPAHERASVTLARALPVALALLVAAAALGELGRHETARL